MTVPHCADGRGAAALLADIETQRHEIADYRATWPDLFATVREAVAAGFWPECYGGGDGPGGSRPPTKFYYPRAGVSSPHHAGGVARGASMLFWTFRDGSPDDLRHEPVWQTSWTGGDACWTGLPEVRGRSGLTFDAAMSWCIHVGDHMQAHYIMPVYERGEPERVHLTVNAWRELATVPVPGRERTEPEQLDLFAPPPPEPRLVRMQRVIAELVTIIEVDGERMARLDADYGAVSDIQSLAAIANSIRQQTAPELPDFAPTEPDPVEVMP